MKRPLLVSFIVLVVAILTIQQNAPFYAFFVVPVLIGIGVVSGNIKSGQGTFLVLLYLVGIAAATTAFDDHLGTFAEKESNITGRISARQVQGSGRTSLVLDAVSIEEEPITGKLQVTIAEGQTPAVGDTIAFTGTLSLPSGKRNPGGFDYALYLRSKGIEGQVWLEDAAKIQITGSAQGLIPWIGGIRQKLIEVSDTFFTPEESLVIKGITLGESLSDTNIAENFRQAGVAHILAVSGLHVGYVFLIAGGLFKGLGIKKRAQVLLMLPILGGYILLTGGSPSVIRAAIMLWILLLGRGMGESSDSLNNLCLAGIILLLIQPAQLFSVGFQLSFGAVLGITLFYEPMLIRCEAFPVPKAIMSSLILTLCATLGTLPATLYHFHEISLLSFVSNLAVVPLAGILLMTALVTLPLLVVLPFLGGVISLPTAFLADCLLQITHFLGEIPFSMLRRGSFSFLELLLLMFMGFLLAGYFDFRKKSQRLGVGVFLSGLVITLGLVALKPAALRLTFLDVGQGDSLLIETPSGGAYLVDGGGYYESDIKRQCISEKVLLPVLYSKNITALNGVFITHNHADHAQGIEEILERMPVDQIFVSSKYNGEALMQQEKVPLQQLAAGDSLSTEDGIHLSVLWPDSQKEALPEDKQNEASLVMTLSYGEMDILLTGDAGEITEDAIVETLPDIEVLKVGHHGSKFGTTQAFLEKAAPEVAIISVGQYNVYGHPASETLKSLKDRGIALYRTDENGGIVLTTNGKTLKIKRTQEN